MRSRRQLILKGRSLQPSAAAAEVISEEDPPPKVLVVASARQEAATGAEVTGSDVQMKSRAGDEEEELCLDELDSEAMSSTLKR